jgi:hypothetical protein
MVTMLRIATNATLGTTLVVLAGCQSMVAPVDVLGVCDPAGQPHVSAMVTRFRPCQVGTQLAGGIAVCPSCPAAGTTQGYSACEATALASNAIAPHGTIQAEVASATSVGPSATRPIVTPFDVRPELTVDPAAPATTDAGRVLSPSLESDETIAPSGPLVRVQRPTAVEPPIVAAPPKPKPVFRPPVTQWSREAGQKRAKPRTRSEPRSAVEQPPHGPLPQPPIPYPSTGM